MLEREIQKNKLLVIANLGPTGPRAAGQLKSPISMYPELACKYGSAMSRELVCKYGSANKMLEREKKNIIGFAWCGNG